MADNGTRAIGALPDGRICYVTIEAIAQYGWDKLRYELVDKAWFDKYGQAPGYFRIRTKPFSDDCVWIKAKSHEEALEKYLRSKEK